MLRSVCRRYLILVTLWLALLPASRHLTGQPPPILLLNPSFEDTPSNSKPPRGWFYCGPPGETPPDVHPSGFFQVEAPAAHGNTYVGMVVRENGTWEALGQQLDRPLEPGQCYRLSMQAARSAHYRSINRLTGEFIQYTDPIRIRLWGGRINCDRAELLASSPLVADTTWGSLILEFQPRHAHRYLIIEAFYPADAEAACRGNVLLDHCSPLIPVDCRSGAAAFACQPLPADAPAGRPGLEELIRQIAGAVTFGAGTAELHNQYFLDESSQPVQENAALLRIARALLRFPDEQLLIAVGSQGKQLTQQRIDRMEEILSAFGLQPRQYRVTPFRPRDRQADWLGCNEEKDVCLRLR